MCSETSSPRLSFSSDLGQNQCQSEEDHSSVMEMGCEFEFSFLTSGFSEKQRSSTADELFSHGIILPTQPIQTPIYNHNNIIDIVPSNHPKKSLPHPLNIGNNNNSQHPKREDPKEMITSTCDNNKNDKPQSRSFWDSFKRSSSLNGESKRSSTLLCSFPLLSRSNSTGSVPSQKRSNGVKEATKSHSYSSSSSPQKPPLISLARSSSSSLSNNNNNNNMAQKPPLKKSYGGSYGNGIRVNPVINLPPPYISKGTAKLFGLGSFLHHGTKDKNTKK